MKAGSDAEDIAGLTGARLRELFGELGVCKRGKLPSGEAMDELAVVVRDLAAEARAHLDVMMRAADARRRRVLEAVEVLQADLPGWRDECRAGAALAGAGGGIGRLLLRQGEAFDALDLALAGALRAGALTPAFSAMTVALDGWHDFVADLAAAFEAAMRTTNPGATIGLTADGPLGRFLVQIIPLMSGERPSAEAIGKYLRDQKTRAGG